MWKPNIDKRLKLLLMIGLGALALGAGYRLFPYMKAVFPGSDQIALKEKQVLKYRQVATEEKGLKERLAQLSQALKQMETGLLSGETHALAAAEMQNILQGIASKSKVDIKSVRVMKADEPSEQDVLSVPVQLTLTSTVAQLKEILYAIDIAPKHLTVEKATLKVPGMKAEGVVYTDMTVVGYMKKTGK